MNARGREKGQLEYNRCISDGPQNGRRSGVERGAGDVRAESLSVVHLEIG